MKYVVKRNGEHQAWDFGQITARIRDLAYGLDDEVDPGYVTQLVSNTMRTGIKTSELDCLTSDICAGLVIEHPDYGILSARIMVSNIHKTTPKSFSKCCAQLYAHHAPAKGSGVCDLEGAVDQVRVTSHQGGAEHKHNTLPLSTDQRDKAPVGLFTEQKHAPLVTREFNNFVQRHADLLDRAIEHARDFEFDIFALKTLMRSYLIQIDKEVAERPQYLWMRVATHIFGPRYRTQNVSGEDEMSREATEKGGLKSHKIHANMDRTTGTTTDGGDVANILKLYEYLSMRKFTQATPTLYNAGTSLGQLSSCFVVRMRDDSIEGIYDTLKEVAIISKGGGGIGLHVQNIRGRGAYIHGTNGYSSGLGPMLRVYDATMRYVDQGGGKRKGSCAMYLPPWHSDIVEFLALKKPQGKNEDRARDLFYALWISDLFMKRVEANAGWSLFSPDTAPGLDLVYGDEFEALYIQYEMEGRAVSVMKARELWLLIVASQTETSTPYMTYKDACMRTTNQKNLGTITGLNLCAEIVEYTGNHEHPEVAVCNLASVNLAKFVDHSGTQRRVPGGSYEEIPSYDFAGLEDTVRFMVQSLNRVIDSTHYPVPNARANLKHRPMGIGAQGLQDAFILMRMPFTSPEARKLNRRIFASIYFAALQMSCELSQQDGPYKSFEGSPASEGLLQFDLHNHLKGVRPDETHDWDLLKANIKAHGLRNSLLIALMPTATTAQIFGNYEGVEPLNSNVFVRKVLSGEFICMNKYLVRDLIKEGLWTQKLRDELIASDGSVQHLNIPQHLKELYKTVWEIKHRDVLDMTADRAIYVCQSQSTNAYMTDPTYGNITSMHFYGWRKGLCTGMYYMKMKSKVQRTKSTISVEMEQEMAERRLKSERSKEVAIAVKPKHSGTLQVVCDSNSCTMCGA